MIKLIYSLALLFLAIFSNAQATRSFFSIIESPKITNWGDWGFAEFCVYPHYAIGFRTKVEASCGKCDDTALNAIQLLCSDGQVITSSEGPWGGWASSFARCASNEKLIGFQIRVEPDQGSGDDTATNAVKMICSNRQVLSSLEERWGYWYGEPLICPPTTYICGIKTQLEPHQGRGDDTALNNVQFYCCQ
jgi:hypothetical protein